MLPWPRPPPILVQNVVFGKLVPNPSCVPNLKLLASTVAEIRRGSQIFGCSPSQAPSNFGPKRYFLQAYFWQTPRCSLLNFRNFGYSHIGWPPPAPILSSLYKEETKAWGRYSSSLFFVVSLSLCSSSSSLTSSWAFDQSLGNVFSLALAILGSPEVKIIKGHRHIL